MRVEEKHKISYRQKLISVKKTKNSELGLNGIIENKCTRPTETVAWFRITLSRNHSGTTVARAFARTTPPSSPNLTWLAMLNQEPDVPGTSANRVRPQSMRI